MKAQATNWPPRLPLYLDLYYEVTYWPRSAFLLLKYRTLPSNMSLRATLRGIVRREIRPHWLRG